MKKLLAIGIVLIASWFAAPSAHAQSAEQAQAAVRALGMWSQGHALIYQRLSELVTASSVVDDTLNAFADHQIDADEGRRRIAAWRAELPIRLAAISSAIDSAPPGPDVSGLGPRSAGMQDLFRQVPDLERRAYAQIEAMSNSLGDLAEQALAGHIEVARATSQRMLTTAREMFVLQNEGLRITIGVVGPSNAAGNLGQAQMALNNGVIALLECMLDDPLSGSAHQIDDAHRAVLTASASTIREQAAQGRAAVALMSQSAATPGLSPAMVHLIIEASANLNQAFTVLESSTAELEGLAASPPSGVKHDDLLNALDHLSSVSDQLDQLAVQRGNMAAHL